MDNPNLPENEIQEATWQEDENRATLFLRSVFVLLSGALILGAERYTSFDQMWLEALYLLGMNVVLPLSIIWFFFGQGLRPVEWLSDQKYNAWNYGINFKDWKTHLKWAGALSLLGILLCLEVFLLSHTFYIVYKSIPFFIFLSIIGSSNFFLLFCAELLLGVSLVWLIWGYLFFGCIQGFSKIPTFILIILAMLMPIVLAFSNVENLILSTAIIPPLTFLLLYLVSFAGCWKTKSIAPMLYSMFFLTVVTFLVTISVIKSGLPIFPIK